MVEFLFLEAPFVTELLLRRLLDAFLFWARDDFVEAFLLHADETARTMLCGGFGVHGGYRSGGRLPKFDDVPKAEKLEAERLIGRLWPALLPTDCDHRCRSNCGRVALLLSGWPTNERHTDALAAQPTFLFMVIGAGTWLQVRRC